MRYFDFPSTTDLITYAPGVQNTAGTSYTWYLNRTVGSTGATNYENGVSYSMAWVDCTMTLKVDQITYSTGTGNIVIPAGNRLVGTDPGTFDGPPRVGGIVQMVTANAMPTFTFKCSKHTRNFSTA